LVGPQLKPTKKIGVCQNEHRPRYRVPKYVTLFIGIGIFSSFIVCIFTGVKNHGPGGWGALNAGGGLVHCTICTTYCYATVLKYNTAA